MDVKVREVGAKNKLERYLENFYGKPIDEIGVIDNSEADYGYDVGGEIITSSDDPTTYRSGGMNCS